MNTAQITHVLHQDPVTRKEFCGVLPSDRLPQRVDRSPCGFIINTDPSTKPGTHWVAFYFPSEQKAEFFDSYGQPPEHYKHIAKDFLNKHVWTFNTRKLQSAWSGVCGQYCIFYLCHRARGYSMKKIVHLFGSDTMLNDMNVDRFVKTRFRVVLRRYSHVQ